MNKVTLLFWESKQKQVIEWHGESDQGSIPEYLHNLDCIDLSFSTDMPTGRYGAYLPNYGWSYIPKEKFDPEFLLTLLLLGVQ